MNISKQYVDKSKNNRHEPVAWMFEYGTDRGDAVNGISWYPNVHFKKPDLSGLIRNIEPLYTHPAKTLTDEEIHYLIVNKVTDYDMIKQALRKAQE